MGKEKNRSEVGLGVDAYDNSVVDPTINVQKLVDASIKRLDDIGALTEKYHNIISDLRARYDEKLVKAESRRQDETGQLRADFQTKLDDAEAKRNDANRAFDLANVAIANERATLQASVLAANVTGTAETLRTIVASSDLRVASLIQGLENKLSERIMALERITNIGTGRQAVSDPQIAGTLNELIAEMRSLRETGSLRSGRSEGGEKMWAYVVGAIGALLGIVSLIVMLVHMFKNG